MAQDIRTLSRRPHTGEQPRLGTRPNGMRKGQAGGNEEDGGVLRTLHGEPRQTHLDEEGRSSQGQRKLDTIRYAMEVDSATRSCCHLSKVHTPCILCEVVATILAVALTRKRFVARKKCWCHLHPFHRMRHLV
jgi:hypothetical protein